ncbi:hypothetical protein PMI40_01029 [Herbaspirillum sp. YR522]|nr:DUF6543 domain-containing protein [Herbaspirillum sp. YR522]EJN08896.1 hypothetical protein PMI40_01029 [Herbaspirillum sp. YR522]
MTSIAVPSSPISPTHQPAPSVRGGCGNQAVSIREGAPPPVGSLVRIGAGGMEAPQLYANTGVARPARPPSLMGLQQQVIAALRSRFPDIRNAAAQAIEARLKRDYGVHVQASQTYLNKFDKPIGNTCSADSGGSGLAYNGSPLASRSLAELQLYASSRQTRALLATPHHQLGIYREGAWADRFDARNEVPLSVGQLVKAVQATDFLGAYQAKFSKFWSDNFNYLVTATETEMLHYAQTHRRAEAPARAVGISDQMVHRLKLSDKAIDMLAEATGNPDPDHKSHGTRTYAFDINS